MAWSALGSAIGAGASIGGVYLANAASKKAAREQMKFQERMSNTSYQRGMADMRAAGLNPMLAYQRGGADSASGASYQAQSMGAGVQDSISSAFANKVARKQAENIDSDTFKKDQEGNTAQAVTDLTWQQDKNAGIQEQILLEQLNSAKAASAQSKIDEKFWKSDAGKAARQLDLIGQSANPFATTAKSARGAIAP